MGDGTKMTLRILFITQDDPFYVRVFFEEFFRLYPRPSEIRGVVLARPMGKRSLLDLARQMWNFYGPVDFARMGARYGAYRVSALLGRIAGPGKGGDLCGLCSARGVPVIYEDDVNDEAFLEKARALDLDLILSVAAPVIFREGLLGLPRLGCLNIHSGRLPRYRGMMPVFWQMYHDEPTVGITIHEMNRRLDDGRILMQTEVPVGRGESLDSVIKRTKKVGARMMVEIIDRIRAGAVQYQENPASESSHFSFPSKEEARAFRDKGNRLL